MAKYFIYLMLIATTLVFSSCGDDEEIYDVDFSEVSLEEGQSRIIGDWYENAHIVYFVKGPTLYYQVHISETEIIITYDSDGSLFDKIYIENWSQLDSGISINVSNDYSIPYVIVFYNISDKKLYSNLFTLFKNKEIEN